MRIERIIHRTSRLLLVGLAGVLIMTLAACDSGGGNGGGENGNGDEFPEPPGRPGFTSSVVGNWTAQLSGSAVYASADRSADSSSPFTIQLHDESGEATIVVRAMASGRLRPGTYAITDQTRTRGVTATMIRSGQPGWDAAAGTLTIIRRDGPQLRGQFRFTVTDGESGRATVTGAFTAVR